MPVPKTNHEREAKMKSKIFLSLFILVFTSLELLGYEFPIKPGTDEWHALSLEQRLTALQIPANILSEMSTKELIEACLNYPYLFTIYASNNINIQLEKVINSFNGFRELSNRNDSIALLFEEYKSLNQEKIEANWSNSRKGLYTIRESYFGFLIVRCLEMSDNSICKEIRLRMMQEMVTRYYKYKEWDSYSIINAMSAAYLVSYLLIQEGDENFIMETENTDISMFLYTGYAPSFMVTEKIIKTAEKYYELKK